MEIEDIEATLAGETLPTLTREQELTRIRHRRLQILKDQAFVKGIDTEPDIFMEIEDIEATLAGETLPTLTHEQELTRIRHRRLQILKDQAFVKGIDTEPHILMEIEDIEAALAGETLPALTHEQKLTRIYNRRLQIREKQAFVKGINTEPYILNEIEDLKVELNRIGY